MTSDPLSEDRPAANENAANTTDTNATGANKAQFSLRTIMFLTAAMGIWLAFMTQSPFQGAGIVIVTAVALTAGAIGHLAYAFVLPWRGTVILTSVLVCSVPALLLGLAGSLGVGGAVSFALETGVAPATALFSSSSMVGGAALLLGWITTLLLAPAHPARPSPLTAVISAFGVTAWFSIGLGITISKYFGA